MTELRAGYTLPVFAAAAAIAALRWLRQGPQSISSVDLDLVEPAETVTIPIAQVAGLTSNSALAIAHSDPGDNLDLTRDTPIWALVEWGAVDQPEVVVIQGGEGVGRQIKAENQENQAAIYAYAQRLLHTNLERQLTLGEKIRVTIILPGGRALAERTSNAAFGVVEGLSLLGTTGISQPLSAPGQLKAFSEALHTKQSYFDGLVFCVGENGLDLATQIGINPNRLVKTANWLGPMLVEAGLAGVQAVLLFGYHGKLIKLAGGIFHTHHHVADGRLEILTAHCANLGLPSETLPTVFASSTAEAALNYLRSLDTSSGTNWVPQVYGAIAQQIDQRCQAYIYTHSERTVQVGSILFDRDRHILVRSEIAQKLLSQVC
ncbi:MULTISPECIES: cobalt-precorrin-5B (C(1))-methyltransferase CbiD [Trichocoleus]|uniref:Cobalt-precorrin-5B C(1)-methyltransferase n=1 Tax=Trichocoleus desertorum GB2-A4 TaxID=2933944 RepID=A0ABV0J466_9CYAN|nr:cobalt-precorrin-5B (C(1))-methyltransferase CbiD [Trichocoleus sp. FACHB-46]MBD1861921.1 cobalt-precorrin-5B (C(1))-methyltransferase [Trichocoleus sp. FACHB-46]